MARVIDGLIGVQRLTSDRPVVIGGLAVLARLANPYRATTDLDVVDRMQRGTPHLELLRRSPGAEPIEPSAVLLPTRHGPVKVDVLAVRQAELDHPSDDAGDRLHAVAHAWAHESATDVTIEVGLPDGSVFAVNTPVAEPGPLIAMKLQAVMNRGSAKQGTDLLDIVRLLFDPGTRTDALTQIAETPRSVADDIRIHSEYWFGRQQRPVLRLIHSAGGDEIRLDDLSLVTELLIEATSRNL